MKDYDTLLHDVERLFGEASYKASPVGLYDPIEYTMHLGGKRLRPALLLAACEMFGGNLDNAVNAALGIEMFHNYTLLHDDLMDQSPLRRGQPTVYRKWNPNTAILSGDTMFALAWRYMLRSHSTRLGQVLECFNETAIEVMEGQQYDMDFEQTDNVSISDYMEMIRRKTAVLLASALKIGALHTGAEDADIDLLYNYGIHLGLAFQLQDDLLDGYGDTAVFGKKTGQDIIDRKKTYLVLRAQELLPDGEVARLRTIYSTPCATDGEAANKVAEVKKVYDAINLRQVVEEVIDKEFTKAEELLSNIGVGTPCKATLRSIAEALMGRKK